MYSFAACGSVYGPLLSGTRPAHVCTPFGDRKRTRLTVSRRRPRTSFPIQAVSSSNSSDPSAQTARHSTTGEDEEEIGGGVVGTRVCIEYCTGCRWGLRASWMATELLVTFDGGEIGEVAVRPSNRSGTFRVWVVGTSGDETLVWCRKTAGRFPELKELKQLVRNAIAPEKELGHSDCGSAASGK